ncbi:MAG: hypothetical protein UT60_C0053G0005 [candidate division CPR2 bacterium GW2011_GWD2_39_7]|nr:MAG: hypothetical protein UT60_C0053G0005 [candidate division CPR2 bacterium GW2011_GWD2_39_7]
MLLTTIIAVSLPLYSATKVDQERKEKETENTYISIARYVGEELVDNIIRIEDLLQNNKDTFKQINDKSQNSSELSRIKNSVSIWRLTSEELFICLDDVRHRDLIISGMLTKIPNDNMASAIKDAYSKMSNLRHRLRRMVAFFSGLNQEHPNNPKELIDHMQKTKAPKSIKSVEEEIDIFLKQARKAVEEINKVIKSYGQELKIITYSPEKEKSKDVIGK